MLRCIIIDDEKSSCEVLHKMLNEYCPNVEVLCECVSAREAKEAVKIYSPDLLFLDIEMPDENGFGLLMQMKEINFEVIFTTAYEQHAMRAIKFCALDFLLKPINEEDLKNAVAKTEKRISGNDVRKRVDTLLYNINYKNQDKQIAIPTSKGLEFISIGDIIRCEGDNNYTWFHLASKEKLMVSKTLGEYEDLLSDYQFLRVHQSHLINLKHVKNYIRGEGGIITMSDLSKVEVSRRKKEEFLKRIEKDLIT